MTKGYQQFRPIEAFHTLVDAYWTNQPGSAAFDRVLPDGCIDLIFRSGADGGRLFTSALIERPLFVEGAGQDWYVGVRFRPAMTRTLLEIDPVDCRDREISAVEIDAAFTALEHALQDCASAEQALSVLKRAVDGRLMRLERDAAPARVREAIALLARGGEVHSIARALGITERSLHRDLLRWSGLAPKSLARILRMQRCLAAIRAGRRPLALIALHTGYADQAHMTRELKTLTGFSPAEIARPSRYRRPVRNLQDAA
ncbi:helix-turn-helix domain-containing protein [Dongia deserti]|uniref:helix-turn-helix domain-containing protein n=1 Tax=Dongia deserti TaxID=2268030 RepID=UPI000E657A07|nr:AraC family transcriptional regulator [Dongia deserti]